MPTRLRKVRKFRGSRSYGWGQVGQHRGAGRRGGRGKTGGHKHHWTRTVVQEKRNRTLPRSLRTHLFGKIGFKRAWVDRPATMNVGELDRVIDRLLAQNLARKEDDGIHIDLSSLGVGKLLGAGRVETPFILKVASHSESALQKVEGAKGKIISEES
jgi:large subunit ribosomal protein L15